MRQLIRQLYFFSVVGALSNRRRRRSIAQVSLPQDVPWEMDALSATCVWPFYLQIILPDGRRFFGATSILNDGVLVAGGMFGEKIKLPVPFVFKPGEQIEVIMQLPEEISIGRKRPRVRIGLHGNKLWTVPGTANAKPGAEPNPPEAKQSFGTNGPWR